MRSVFCLRRASFNACRLPAPVENRVVYTENRYKHTENRYKHTENRYKHTENRISSLKNRTTHTQHYRTFLSDSVLVPEEEQKSVRVAIVGSPNVGKSTLLNSLMQQYISPVSRMRNTTWSNVSGVITQDDIQVIFIDTPGLLPGEFRESRGKSAMFYERCVSTIQSSLRGADVVLFLLDCSESLYKLYITSDLENIIESIPDIPKILVLNKIDKAREKEKIECIVDQLTKPRPPLPVPSISVRSDINPRYLTLQYQDDFRDGAEFDEVVTISALQGQHVNYLWYKVRQLAVYRPWEYSPDTVSPDGIEDVVTSIVRAEILKKSGYAQAYKLDHKFIGYKEEGEKLIIEFVIFRRYSIFKSKEMQEESVEYIENILSTRFGCPVEFRLLDRRYSQHKSQFLDILDLSEEPDIDVFDESE